MEPSVATEEQLPHSRSVYSRGRHIRRRLAPSNPSLAKPPSSSPPAGGGAAQPAPARSRPPLPSLEPPHLSPVPCPKSRSAHDGSHGGACRGALSCARRGIPDRRRAAPPYRRRRQRPWLPAVAATKNFGSAPTPDRRPVARFFMQRGRRRHWTRWGGSGISRTLAAPTLVHSPLCLWWLTATRSSRRCRIRPSGARICTAEPVQLDGGAFLRPGGCSLLLVKGSDRRTDGGAP